jgi:hypothetical protein
MTTTAKVRAKGLAATGVTEDLAAQMFNTKGSRYLAIVELKVDEVHEKSDGDRRVDLVIEELEPVVDGKLNGALDEHVRTIWKALYENRLRAGSGPDDQLPLDPDDGPAPKVADIIAREDALIEKDADGEPVGIWDGDTDAELEDEPESADEQDRPTTTPFSVVPS